MRAVVVDRPTLRGFRVKQLLRVSRRATEVYLKSHRMYAQDFAMQLLTYPFQLLVVWYLWQAALATGALRGAQTQTAIAYYAAVFLLARIVDFGRMTWDVENDIHSGQLMVYLARPLFHWQVLLARTFARAIVGTALSLPLLLLLVGYGLGQTVSAAGTIGLLVTGLVGALLEFTLFYVVGLMAFWVERVWGIMLAIQFSISLFGGRLLPLHFYPDWFRAVLPYLPFRYVAYEPVQLFLGSPSWGRVAEVLALQLLWLVAAGTVALLVWRAGSRQFTAQGS